MGVLSFVIASAAPVTPPQEEGALGAILLILWAAVGLWGVGWYGLRVLRGAGRVKVGALGVPDLMFVGVLGMWLLLMGLGTLLTPKPATPSPVTDEALIFGGLVFGVLVLVVSGFLQWRRVPVGEVLGFCSGYPPGRTLGAAVGLMALGYPLILMAYGLMQTVVGTDGQEQAILTFFREAMAEGNTRSLLLATGTAVIIAPVAEEFLFRGYFHGTLRRFIGPLGGAFLSAVLFALIHDSVAALLPLFVFAMVLSLAYEVTGSLWVPIIMHVIFNSITLGSIYFSLFTKAL